jgi:hypothetical protein
MGFRFANGPLHHYSGCYGPLAGLTKSFMGLIRKTPPCQVLAGRAP